MFSTTLREVMGLCLEMDEKFWPDVSKEIRGAANGTQFAEKYTPSKDIAGDYTVDVSYGFAAGMDPNRALVFLLQLRGDKLIDRDTVQRQLPMQLDVSQLQARIDIEEVNDALKAGMQAMLQGVGALAAQGMDPTMILQKAAQIVDAREKGTPLHEAIIDAFKPEEPPPSELTPGATPPGPGGESLGGGAPPGMDPMTGMPPGMVPGQAGPGGQPDLQTLVAGLTGSGRPDLGASVRRRLPA